MSRVVPEELRSLGNLFREVDPAPERAVGVAYRAVDRLVRERAAVGVLEPIADSAPRPRAPGDPGGTSGVRTLSFAAPGRLVELELRATSAAGLLARGIVLSRSGQPGPAGTMIVRHGWGERRGELDGCGAFAVRDVPSGPLSLLLCTRRADGTVADRLGSDWFVC